tara:strand:+ start:165 stop:560 length:396 start_codon:yes stop_codon:yes gene_type:complete
MDQAFIDALTCIEGSLHSIAKNLPDTPYLDTDGIERALYEVANGFAELAPRRGEQYFDKSLENIDEHLAKLNEVMDNQDKWLHDINISLRLLVQMKVYELSHSNVPMPEARGTITEPLDQNENSPYWADDL